MKNLLKAKITIHGLPDFTEKDKKSIIDWLKDRIKDVRNNKQYAKRYTARIFK